jgi:hypothetical protein
MGRYDLYDDLEDDIDVRRWHGLERPHSGQGFASLVMGVIAAVGGGCATAVAVMLDAAQQGPDDELLMGLFVLLFLGCGALAIAGFVVGIAGSFQSDRKPILAILGAVLNGLTILGMATLFCIGILSDL